MNIIELLANRRIEEAIERGDLDDLPGKGQPLDLSDDIFTPESLRMMYRILKNANIVPVEVELMKEVADLRESLDAIRKQDPESPEIDRIRKEIAEKQTLMNTKIEGFRRMFK